MAEPASNAQAALALFLRVVLVNEEMDEARDHHHKSNDPHPLRLHRAVPARSVGLQGRESHVLLLHRSNHLLAQNKSRRRFEGNVAPQYFEEAQSALISQRSLVPMAKRYESHARLAGKNPSRERCLENAGAPHLP